jgi:hypothetical protein
MSTPELCLAAYAIVWLILCFVCGYGVLGEIFKMCDFLVMAWFQAFAAGRKDQVEKDLSEIRAGRVVAE